MAPPKGTTTPKKEHKVAFPSASIVLLSPQNQVLLLHRVRHSRSFPSAHVFPGGNLSAYHEGPIPPPEDPARRHADGRAYRLAAVRETFEESGILLAQPKVGIANEAPGQQTRLLELPEAVRNEGRRAVHANEVRFEDWLGRVGGVPDLEGLVPFTRWVTPTTMPKRFTTQMYLYAMPLAEEQEDARQVGGLRGAGGPAREAVVQVPTDDGGLEHTAATFEDAAAWVGRARRNEIIVFPPQMYLLALVQRFTGPQARSYAAQREALLRFVREPGEGGLYDRGERTGRIAWADKVMSPRLLFTMRDGRQVLGVDGPGPELKGSGRGGDGERVVLVRFKKEGPRDVEVRTKEEVVREYRREQDELEGGESKL